MRHVRILMMCWLSLAVMLLMTACGYWGRRSIDQTTPLNPHDPVWIWSHGTVSKLRDVVITQDLVSGIPFGTSENCYATCRRSIPRAQVDSMMQGYRTTAQKVTTVTSVAIVAWFVWGEACHLLARGDPQCLPP